MEKIHNGRAIKTEKVDKAEKGTVTVRQRGNSYEARVRLELKKVMKGVEKILDYLGLDQLKKLQKGD